MFANFFDGDDLYNYTNAKPFNFIYRDNFLNSDFATSIQNEILNIPDREWDRYENPFEKKFTLRNKHNFPPHLTQLFSVLESDMVIQELQKLCGKELYTDPTRNFWGVHKFQNGDHLDIHVDAGSHPLTGKKKVLTLGIYLSKNWEDNQTGALELWNGDNASLDTAKIYDCKISLKPLFNRMILFNNDDYSWHGSPSPVEASENQTRIFVTISYFSNCQIYQNKRVKAFFVPMPNDPQTEYKNKLRLIRCNPTKYMEVYRTS